MIDPVISIMTVAGAGVSVAAFGFAWRLARGPRGADRLLAAHGLIGVSILALAILAVAFNRPDFALAALALTLGGFAGILAWARLLSIAASEGDGDG